MESLLKLVMVGGKQGFALCGHSDDKSRKMVPIPRLVSLCPALALSILLSSLVNL